MLDKHSVPWNRPKTGFEWFDEAGVKHRYYPDFYLPKHDLYLDPKNPWERQKGRYKLEYVRSHYPIRLILLDKNEVKEDALLSILKMEPPRGFEPR